MLWYLHIPEGASISRLIIRQLSGDGLWSPRLLLLVAIKNVVKVSVLRDLPLLDRPHQIQTVQPPSLHASG